MGIIITSVVKVAASLLLATILILLRLRPCRGGHQQEKEMSMTVQLTMDKRLDKAPFLTFSPRGIRWCAEECYRRQRCQSFNFMMANLKCELIDKSSNDCNKVTEKGAYYADSSAWPGTKQGSCGMSCDENYMCAKDKDNKEVCFPAECLDPPSVNNADDPDKTFAEIGGNVTYSCKSGTLTGDATIKCKTNTNWTEPDFSCT